MKFSNLKIQDAGLFLLFHQVDPFILGGLNIQVI
jgi:hypothetical protein